MRDGANLFCEWMVFWFNEARECHLSELNKTYQYNDMPFKVRLLLCLFDALRYGFIPMD